MLRRHAWNWRSIIETRSNRTEETAATNTHTHTKRINTHTHAQFDLRVDFMRYINFELNSALLLVVRLECIVLVETTSQHLVWETKTLLLADGAHCYASAHVNSETKCMPYCFVVRFKQIWYYILYTFYWESVIILIFILRSIRSPPADVRLCWGNACYPKKKFDIIYLRPQNYCVQSTHVAHTVWDYSLNAVKDLEDALIRWRPTIYAPPPLPCSMGIIVLRFGPTRTTHTVQHSGMSRRIMPWLMEHSVMVIYRPRRRTFCDCGFMECLTSIWQTTVEISYLVRGCCTSGWWLNLALSNRSLWIGQRSVQMTLYIYAISLRPFIVFFSIIMWNVSYVKRNM